MSWIAAATIGSSVVGGYFANKAAGQQADAANNATALQSKMFDTTQKNLDPFMKAGTGALGQITAGTQPGGALMPQSYTPYDMSKFQSSPEYQLMMQQNTNALDSSQNASSKSGGANSNNMKSLMGWTQGNSLGGYQSGLNDYMQQFLTGNQARAQQFNTLDTIAGSGQNAAANLGGMSTQVGGQIGDNMVGAGNARASGTIGVGNAITGGMNQGYQAWLQGQYMNQGPSAQDTANFAANG